MMQMNEKRQEERNKAYSKIASDYRKSNINELQKKPLDRKIYDLFYDKVVNTGTVLEIGCGPGEISNYLWMKGLDIIGIDYSKEMIEEAKSFNGEINFEIGNVFELKYATGTVAGIVAPYLIVNFTIEEVKEALAEMNRVLRPKGILLVTFHIGDDEEKIFEDFFIAGNRITYNFFMTETIKRSLVETGFELHEIVVKEPYQGEVTTRAFIFAEKQSPP
jgi:ubiquinone/menaquinone biosynthesis C-methylase UbiE